uniref:Protein YIPF3 n=1 Tax=Schistocephalus solidus TaxID=70667 RepID=A0A183TH38_SCHSO
LDPRNCSQRFPHRLVCVIFLLGLSSIQIWTESKKRAETAYKTYGRIDFLRPYFDVEPNEVLQRVASSVDPRPFKSAGLGYAMCSTCVVLFICSVVHQQASEAPFFIFWALLCGSAAIKLASTLWIFIPGEKQRIVASVLSVVLHMGFVIYLHFAYHRLIEGIGFALFTLKSLNADLSDAIGDIATVKASAGDDHGKIPG